MEDFLKRLDFSYTYTVLRYAHDASKGEFANVGVVLSSADTGESVSILMQDTRKIESVFPDADTKHYLEVIRHLQDQLDQLAKAVTKPYNVYEIAFAALPQDLGRSFHWSGMGCGMSIDLWESARSLFQSKVRRARFTDR